MRRVGHVLLACLVALVLVLTGFWAAAAWRETETADRLAPATGRFVETRRGRIFVQEAGPADGRPVLLVHGTAAWSELWRPSLDDLGGRGFRVVAIDLPPFGFSDRDPAGDYGRPAQAERLLALLDALGLRAPTIVAHSIGAAPVVEAAIRAPERVGALVLVCGALGLRDGPVAESGSPARSLLAIAALRDPLVAATLTNPLLTRALFSRLVAKPDGLTDPVIATLQRPMRLRGSTPALGRWLHDLLGPERDAESARPDRYGAARMPTALIWGEKDAVTPLAQGERARALFPDATLAVLPGLGHVPQVEDPAAFRDALDAALARVAPR